MLAPRHRDPGEALARSWRLLAQHAVAGTIQAGGRFDWDATNLVFERPGLFELAGFRVREARPDDPGLAGAFAAEVDRLETEWRADRDAVRAKRAAGYLRRAEGKSATINQCVAYLRDAHGLDDGDARALLSEAGENGHLRYDEEAGVLSPADENDGQD
jgi:hypothetical protein